MNWHAEHIDELIEQYAGQWIAIKDDMVVAHGKTMVGVYSDVTSKGVVDAFFIRVHSIPVHRIA